MDFIDVDNRLRVRARRDEFSILEKIHVRLFVPQRGGGGRAAKPIDFVELQPGEEIPTCFALEPEQAQKLIDDLWDCGLRPSEGSGSAGALAATQRHLEDLRAIVMHKLGISKPMSLTTEARR